MNKQDLRQFKAVQHKLTDKESVETLYIRASECPTPSLTHGGPVFMAVGQVIELDVVGEGSKRRLDTVDEPAVNVTDTTVQESSVTETASTPEASTNETVTATETQVKNSTEPHSNTKISAGMNAGHNQPLQTHSTPSTKVGTPGDRYIFTESPVEYYYYHQPVVQKV